MTKRARKKAAMRIVILTPRTRTDGVTLGLLLTLFFWGGLLLRCGDVEQNPGPNKADNYKQTRLSSAGRRGSADMTGAQDSGQTTSSPQQPTNADIMGMLTSMNNTFKEMNSKFTNMEKSVKDLSDQFATLQSGVKDLREEVGTLREENSDLARKNCDLTARVEQLERKTDDLEGRSKRNNLIFYGIPRDQNESGEQCEGKVRDLITDKLELAKDIEFDRIHRLNAKPDSPIIARCSFYKDKVTILKVKRKLKGSDVFVGEDFSSRVREIRRGLAPHLKKARSEGKRATMIFDHLLVDGKKYFLDDQSNLKESRWPAT